MRQQRGNSMDGPQPTPAHGDSFTNPHATSSTSSAQPASRSSKSSASGTWHGIRELEYEDPHTSWPTSSAPEFPMGSPYGLGSSAVTSGQPSALTMDYPSAVRSTGHSYPYSTPSVPQYGLSQDQYPYTLPPNYGSSPYAEHSYTYDSHSNVATGRFASGPLTTQPIPPNSNLLDPYSVPATIATTSTTTTRSSPSAVGSSSRYASSRSNSTLYDEPRGSSIDSSYYQDSGKYQSLSASKQKKTAHRRHK